jgi:hypothetical protein
MYFLTQAAEEEMRIKFELQKKERKTRIANTSVIQHSYSWNQTENQATNYDNTPPNVSTQHRSNTSSMQLMPPPPPVSSPNINLHTPPEKSCVSVLQPAFTAVTTAGGATSSKTAMTGAKRSRDAEEDTTTDHNGGSKNESASSEDDGVPVSKKRNSGGYFFGLFG